MSSHQAYDCFDTYDTGHFDSVDTLFDAGVWIGYFTEASRSTCYRGLPSFRELEYNYKNLSPPFPEPTPDSRCSDREAVCRGCFCNESTLLQLCEVRFGRHGKLVVMPLKGAGEAGLFSIMMPQPFDRSMKSLETFRPFMHDLENSITRSFGNRYMLLSIRDRSNGCGLVHTVSSALGPRELAWAANRPARARPTVLPTVPSSAKSTVEKKAETETSSRLGKRTHRKTAGNGPDSPKQAKRGKAVTINSWGRNADTEQFSSDNLAEPLSVPCARSAYSGTRSQPQTPMLPSIAPQYAPMRELSPPQASYFTDDQARQVHFVWKIEFEGLEYEIRRSLNAVSTFRGLLESFREEAEVFPTVGKQLKACIWTIKYIFPDGINKAVVIKPSSPHSELSFEGFLRQLAEKDLWSQSPRLILELKLAALIASSGD